MNYNAIEEVQAILAERKNAKKMRNEGLFSLNEVYDTRRVFIDISVYYRASTCMHRVARFYENYGFDVVKRDEYYVIYAR